MDRYKSAVIIFITLILLTACDREGKKPPLIPMENFFRNPVKSAFKLSPDGSQLAFMQPWQKRMNVYVQKIDHDDAMRISASAERDIKWYFWANNNRIIYLKDTGGDLNYRMYAVDSDGKNLTELTPFENVRTILINQLEDNPDEMIIGMNKRDPSLFDAYRININSGEMKMIAENPGNVIGWWTDWDGRLRLVMTADGTNTALLYRKNENEPFEKLLETNFREMIEPVIFTFDNEMFYAVSNIGRDKLYVVRYDPETNSEVEVLYQHPEVDVYKLLISKKRRKIIGVVFHTDRRQFHFFDDQRKQLQKALQRRLPDYELSVVNMSDDENKVLIQTSADKTRGAYYFYNRETDELKKLVEMSPWLKEEEMAEMQSIRYLSRDSLVIRGYLTLPKGSTGQNLPLVVKAHGGFSSRDYWGFDPEVQFLANRGYAVLQINFRGSFGFGRDFWQAGFKEFGKKIENDIVDGVRWLIDQKIADPERIAIFGTSVGGYHALAGVTFSPDLYAAGIDYLGICNLLSFLKDLPPHYEPFRDMYYAVMGNPEKDKAYLKSVSPYFHVDQIKAPLLIARGANDPLIDISESDTFVEKLRDNNIPVQYIVKENEGHGFMNEENRFDLYKAMETFLANHLGGRAPEKE